MEQPASGTHPLALLQQLAGDVCLPLGDALQLLLIHLQLVPLDLEVQHRLVRWQGVPAVAGGLCRGLDIIRQKRHARNS